MKHFHKILLLLSCFVVGKASAQTAQNWPNTIFTPTAYDKAKALRIFVIPSDTLLLNIADSGAIAYKNSNQFIWTGYLWKLSSGSGGSADSGILATNYRVDTAKGFIRASIKDLSDQLGGYYPFPAGTATQYVKGDGNLATMDTTVIPSFSTKVRSLIRAIDITNALAYPPLRPLDTANLDYRQDTLSNLLNRNFRFANPAIGTAMLRSVNDSTAMVKSIQVTGATIEDQDTSLVIHVPPGLDNVPMVQMRNEKLVKLSLPIRYEGNSITAAAGATDTAHGYPALVYAQHAVSYVNTAVSNSSVRDVISRQFSNAAATKVSTSLSIMMGTNNLRQDNLGTKQSAIKEALRVIIANQFVDSIWAISNAKFTKNGSWSNFTTTNLTSKSVAKSLGNPMKSSTAGNTLTFLWTGDNMIIGTYAWQGYHNLGRFSVTVDGSNKGTYSGRDLCSDHQSQIGTYDYRQPTVYILTGLGAGTHSVTITLLDNAETDIDYIAKFMTIDNCASVLVAHITKCTPAGYVAYGDLNSSDAATDTANANIDTVVNYFRTVGFPVGTVYTENYLDIAASGTGDGLHPGNAGYAQLAKAWAAAIDFGSSGTGGATQLSALTDVAVSGPAENDVLTVNGSGKWANVPGLVANLTSPTDGDMLVQQGGVYINKPALLANLTSPAAGDVLVNDGTEWINKPTVNVDLTGISSGDVVAWDGTKFAKHSPSWLPAVGTEGQVVKVVSGVWAAADDAGGGGGSYSFVHSIHESGGNVDLIGDSSTLAENRVYASISGVRSWYRTAKMNLSSPANGDLLFFQSSDTSWVNHTISGDFTISNTGVGAIGALKVTNTMLAGSIAASKLVGTDIATVGTVTTGTWNATAISTSKGGAPAAGTSGQVLTKNSSSNYDYSWTTPSAGFADPMTSIGDLIIRNASNVTARLAGNTTTTMQLLSSTGNGSAAAAPSWHTLVKGDIGLGSVENTAISTWAGSANVITLGAVTTGTWNATAIGTAKGGAPSGGTANQVLAKNSSSNYDYSWVTPASGFADPMTTVGDIIIRNASNVTARLAGNTSATMQVLTSTGTGAAAAAPVWHTMTKSDLGLANAENTAISTWAGSANLVTVGAITTGTWNATAISVSKGGLGLTSALNGLVKGNGSGYTTAAAGTDYYAPGGADVAVADGGTAISSYTLGDLLYASAGTTLAKLAGNTASTKKFLTQTGTGTVSAAPAWGAISDADVAFSDVTTGNVSTSAHGYMKKLPGDATLMYSGDGNFSTVVTSSTYTPTISNTTNCSATGNLSHWLRIGNEVTVWGTINPLATTIGECYFEISLPVASNLASSVDCIGGSDIESNGPFTGGGITGNTTTHLARLHFTAPNTSSSTTFNYSFTYTVK